MDIVLWRWTARDLFKGEDVALDPDVRTNKISEVIYERSSFCVQNACVEVARTSAEIYIRDSKTSSDGSTVLRFTIAEWRAFLLGVKSGEFDA